MDYYTLTVYYIMGCIISLFLSIELFRYNNTAPYDLDSEGWLYMFGLSLTSWCSVIVQLLVILVVICRAIPKKALSYIFAHYEDITTYILKDRGPFWIKKEEKDNTTEQINNGLGIITKDTEIDYIYHTVTGRIIENVEILELHRTFSGHVTVELSGKVIEENYERINGE